MTTEIFKHTFLVFARMCDYIYHATTYIYIYIYIYIEMIDERSSSPYPQKNDF